MLRVWRRKDHSTRSFLKNTIAAQIHATGSLLILLGAYELLPMARAHGSGHFWSCLVFLGTGFIVFTASTVYHVLSEGFESSPRLIQLLDNIDHFGIYLFIAGTYTPVLKNSVRSPWQEILMASIWTIALLGIFYTAFKPRFSKFYKSRIFSTAIFVFMGWVLVVRIGELFQGLDAKKLWYLAAGGLSYSIGAIIYALKKPKLLEGLFGYHELWHCLVLLGAFFHYMLVRSFYA